MRLHRTFARELFWLVLALPLAWLQGAEVQKAWFADGFHGGIYGHYPSSFTQFIVDGLRQHPDWKLNLEIEPETWDFARTNTPEAYRLFKTLVAQEPNRRIEFVNPAYGQSYLWNISGESVIQQFERGLRKIHEHFPDTEIATYCTEEPCFTSALPGILRSFGFKYAVLKNPNTCWGGYTRAHGGEFVTWVGPDGTGIRTVPRYAIETLKTGSTWETIAALNTTAYIDAAREAGIAHPVGMCLQDAGWRFGPWLRHVPDAYRPSEYVTWSQYFETVAPEGPAPDWRFSQEDIQVSLVWGAQVLQRIAQQVRSAEDRIIMAEKLAALASVYGQASWPGTALDEAWRELLLAQHHDCWIVPYNGRRDDTWADKVRRWTQETCRVSEKVRAEAMDALSPHPETSGPCAVRVFNTLGSTRTNLVNVAQPAGWTGPASVWDDAGHELDSQFLRRDGESTNILFVAPTPALGFNTFWLKETPAKAAPGATAIVLPDGTVCVETDLYRVELDPKQGGAFRSLVAKKLGKRELVDGTGPRRLNEIRGFFFQHQRFESTADSPAKIEIVESGPVRVRLRVSSQIASNALTHWITMVQGEPRIDMSVTIDWQGNPGIGADYRQSDPSRAEEDRKAFYDDRYKLLALFPLNLRNQKVFKDAPFDVTESRLTNTLFGSWSEIKNNVLLHWVDVYDSGAGIGVALLTDHTTTYAHGTDHLLGLTLQYRGVGLWGRDYSVQGPTTVNYALLPHAGDWQAAKLWTASTAWSEPLASHVGSGAAQPGRGKQSLLTIEGADWEVPTLRLSDGKILVRLFNPSKDGGAKTLRYGATADKVELVKLNGQLLRTLPVRRDSQERSVFELALPPMGIGTLRISPGTKQ